MVLSIDITARVKVEHLLYFYWKSSAIVSELRSDDINCSLSTVYN